MKSSFASIILFATVATVASAHDIDSSMGTRLVKFYAPWCGYCTKFAPAYQEVAEHFANSNVQIDKVNCDENRDFCAKHDVDGYPTVKLYHNDQVYHYPGSRTKEGLVEFIMNHVKDIHWKSSEDVETEEDEIEDVQFDEKEKVYDDDHSEKTVDEDYIEEVEPNEVEDEVESSYRRVLNSMNKFASTVKDFVLVNHETSPKVEEQQEEGEDDEEVSEVNKDEL